MKSKGKLRGFFVNEAFYKRPEVRHLIEKEGCLGLGRLISVCMFIIKFYNSIATYDDIRTISDTVESRPSFLKKWIRECGIFDCDDKNGLFTYKYIRHLFGKENNVTDREIYLIKKYGNHISKDPEEEVPDAEIDNIKLTSCKDKDDIKSTSSDDEVDYHDNDSVDNKKVSASPNTINNTNKNINNNISNKNRNKNINISRNSADAAAESSFIFFEKKIFNEKKWNNAKSLLHEINIDYVTHIFKKYTCIFISCILSKLTALAFFVWNLAQDSLAPPKNSRRKASGTLNLTLCMNRISWAESV